MNEHRLTAFAPRMLSVLRIMSGLLFLAHGTQKFLFFPGGESAGFGWTFSHPAAYAGLVELVAGALVAVGLFTRPAAFLASGTMAFAYFMGHASQSFWPVNNGGDAAILYCFLFLYFVFAGPGPISVDAYRVRRAGKLRGT
ncbi:DoxX family protein [Aquibaculum sediminis]|uniref:DoxX family protein n=1 Tax=Aquibaculum sediminis TaxID=3231907 RepID=UPI003452E8E8